MTRLPQNVAVVNPLNHPDWNEKVLKCPDSSVFHSAEWARLLAHTYGYHPTYLILSESNDFRACLPVMEVDSVVTGRRGVSLTFSDYCLALAENRDDFERLFESVLELGKMSGWRYVEFRGEKFLKSQQPSKAYAHHEIKLCSDETQMYASLRESTARNIKRALKEDVDVTVCQTLQGVMEFYRLHCLTRKRQGLPPQPAKFFGNLHKELISRDMGFTVLARKGNIVVAGVVCLYFGANAVYKYGASDLRYQNLRANNLVLWEAIKRCARQGCRSLSLGRSDLQNEGLITFKNGWGGSRTFLNYYKYDFAANNFVTEAMSDMPICKTVFKRLPISFLRALGDIAYRHMG